MMIAMGVTKFANYCRSVFETDLKAIDVSQDKYYFARKFIDESYSKEMAETCNKKLDKFIEYLKSKNLKVVCFGFAFSQKHNKYVYQYVVRSKVHNNRDLKIDGLIDHNSLPFQFFPNQFAHYFSQILDEAPYHLFEQVSKGD
jgi:hypothetical protein